ncbi:MAG: molybdate ABC transporter substrate-binding protein [Chloroflexi bacterium]|nr:molybdate ABC transporter substrate-binding protein [Chloroflexota bacterium]
MSGCRRPDSPVQPEQASSGGRSVATPRVCPRGQPREPRSAARSSRIASKLILWLLCCAVFTIFAACGERPSRTEVIVFAAASLAEPLQQIQVEFESLYPEAKLLFHFAGSQQLRTQIELNAAVDVYVSADATMVDDLVDLGLINGPTSTFARNRVQVLLAPGNPGGIQSLRDLAKPGKRIVLGVPEVPVGRASREALALLREGLDYGRRFAEGVASNIVSEEMNVRGVIARLGLGEVDAGFAYESDSYTASASEMTSIKLPDYAAVEVRYGAGALSEDAAGLPARFVEFLTSETAQQIFRNRGLIVDGS